MAEAPELPSPSDKLPIPDPTVLTTEQLLRAIAAERERTDGQLAIRDERLAGIDRATELRMYSIVGIPGMIDEKVGNLARVLEARVASMNDKLDRADGLRLELKADSKTQIDAALLAQKEQATLQDQANQKAIDKQNDQNEKASDKLTELFRAEMAALRTEIGGIRNELGGIDVRVTRSEGAAKGVQNAVAFAFAALTILIAIGAVAVTVGLN